MSGPTFPISTPLTILLQAAGFTPAMVATRNDGQPLREEDVALIRRILEAYNDGQPRYTSTELGEAYRALRDAVPQKATGTGGE
jgi:hypothetical protein